MTRYTTLGKLPANFCLFLPSHVSYVQTCECSYRHSLFRPSSDRVLYDPLNEVRQHSIANACEAAGPWCNTARPCGDYRIHSMIKKVADDTRT